MKIVFLLLPEDGEQSKRKNEQIPLFFRCWPSCPGHAAGKRPLLHGIFSSFSSRTRRGYMNRRPCPRARLRGHTTQRARGQIFTLSLHDPAPRLSLLPQAQAAGAVLKQSEQHCLSSLLKQTWGFPSQFNKSTKVLVATPQGRRLGTTHPSKSRAQNLLATLPRRRCRAGHDVVMQLRRIFSAFLSSVKFITIQQA